MKNNQAIDEFLYNNKHWSIKNNKLHRRFVFKNFSKAFAFMTEVALFAEKNHHHPEWFNSYKEIVVDLITHEKNSITEKDITLALKMESMAT